MSWEEMSAEQRACPCGQGVFTIRRYMDDWNRVEDRWAMNCPRCTKEYTLDSFSYYHSGLHQVGYRWVVTVKFKQAQSLRKEAEQLKARAFDAAKRRYLSRWLSRFEGQTKKDVWTRLTANGEQYPSLGTFYKHLRDGGQTRYLTDYFAAHLETALALIGVADTEIRALLSRAKDTDAEADRCLAPN
jgi:hypothetical protein